MAYYKTWDPAKAAQSPVFALWFRRYAPFDTFGGAALGYRFEGDHRDSASTSPSATSRTYGCMFFNRNEVLYGFSGSSGTRLASWFGLPTLYHPTGTAKVSLEVTERRQPYIVAFTASTAGSMPLLPGSPDIDTIVKAQFTFAIPKLLQISVQAFGDNFPNLEVFLVSPPRTALLIDGRTTGWRDTGPATRLLGSHEKHSLGQSHTALLLTDTGHLATDFIVGPTKLPEYRTVRFPSYLPEPRNERGPGRV